MTETRQPIRRPPATAEAEEAEAEETEAEEAEAGVQARVQIDPRKPPVGTFRAGRDSALLLAHDTHAAGKIPTDFLFLRKWFLREVEDPGWK